MTDQIRFVDGAAYERYMGKWSQLVGEIFLDWLAVGSRLRWLDVGCGNGAFTEMIAERCAPASIDGIDPSEEQLAFARRRPRALLAEFRKGDAMALPFSDGVFDVWTAAGLTGVDTREISVHRTFSDFDDYWTTILGGASVGPSLAGMSAENLSLLKARLRVRLPADPTGGITYSARANAVKGVVKR